MATTKSATQTARSRARTPMRNLGKILTQTIRPHANWKIQDALEHVGIEVNADSSVVVEMVVGADSNVQLRRVPSTSELAQTLLNAATLQKQQSTHELRRQLTQRTVDAVLSGTRWLTPTELNEVRQAKTTNPSHTVKRWIDSQRIFAIERGNARLIPAYALDDLGEPIPMLHEVLKIMAGHTPFRIAAWFESPTAYLDGKRPRELLATHGLDVVQAAQHSVLGPVHG